MKVIKLSPQGYCGGVKKAIDLVYSLKENKTLKRPFYILGHLIHNKKVCDNLKELGFIIIDENNRSRLSMLDDIKGSGTVIITAHGASFKVKEKIKEKGLDLVDATCPYVLLIQNKIIEKIYEGYEVYYIGTKGHPECEGVLEIDNKINLIDSKNLEIPKIQNDLVYVTNQTTLSSIDLKEFYKNLKLKYPNILIDDKICNATALRQEAVINQEDSELLFVVGDKLSSNSKKLRDVSIKHRNIESILIEDVSDIKDEMIRGKKVVSVTSGASTPSYITDSVVEFLKNYNE